MANNGLRVGSKVQIKIGRGVRTGKIVGFRDDGTVAEVKLDGNGTIAVRDLTKIERVG